MEIWRRGGNEEFLAQIDPMIVESKRSMAAQYCLALSGTLAAAYFSFKTGVSINIDDAINNFTCAGIGVATVELGSQFGFERGGARIRQMHRSNLLLELMERETEIENSKSSLRRFSALGGAALSSASMFIEGLSYNISVNGLEDVRPFMLVTALLSTGITAYGSKLSENFGDTGAKPWLHNTLFWLRLRRS